MTITTRIFGTEDIRRLTDAIGLDAMMDQMIDRQQAAFEAYDELSHEVPVRSGFHYESPNPGLIEWMPVMARGQHALMKLVCYHPNNPSSAGLPTILSSFSLMDTATGHLIAVADGTFLTALRTGAASALATRVMARTDGITLGVIGCGAQAVTQVHAISRVASPDLVLYWDSDSVARQSFPERLGVFLPEGIRLRESPLELIVPNVDVLCTATSIAVGEGPLFSEIQARPHLHINAVGSDFPGKFELPKPLLDSAIVVPDFTSQALAEGECQLLEESELGPELHTVLKGNGPDELQERLSVFDSTGWALEDLVAMELLVEWAESHEIGAEVQLESIPLDPRNPYHLAAGASSMDLQKGRSQR